MRSVLLLLGMAFLPLLCWSKNSVQLVSSLNSPQTVGTIITLEAKPVVEGDPDKVRRFLQFRYSASVDGGPYRMIADFNGGPLFAWRPELYEHEAKVKVTMRNRSTKETAEAELPFHILPRATSGRPVVSGTAVPLVALFSAPACPQGSDFRVAFHRVGDSRMFHTNSEPCRGNKTNNVYVAGMRADSNYEMRGEVSKGAASQAGPALVFHTGLIDGAFPPAKVLVPADDKSSANEPFLVFTANRPTATDLEGNLVWYVPLQDESLVRLLPGGHFLSITPGGSSWDDRVQTLTEFDLAGNVVRQTNMGMVAEQVGTLMKIKSICKPNGGLCVAGFHHDAIRLSNGHTVAIGTLEKMFPEGGQGSDDPVDIMGNLLIDLDENMEVRWVWNSFDHLDVSRKALGDDKCRGKFGGLPCAPVYLGETANDWLHGNAVSYIAKDHNLLMSLPEQDWVIKIDYQDGKGSGKVIWKLGEGGDFKSDQDDKTKWFSYQHDAAFEPPGSDTLVLFDNGHRRQKKEEKKDDKPDDAKKDEPKKDGPKKDDAKADDKSVAAKTDSDKKDEKATSVAKTDEPKKDDVAGDAKKDNKDSKEPWKPPQEAHSRGQVWKIDEESKKATLLVNADIGGYAPYMGSAQRLSNGNFHFNAATVRTAASRASHLVEVTPDGKIVYTLETYPTYRSNRVADLYTPPR